MGYTCHRLRIGKERPTAPESQCMTGKLISSFGLPNLSVRLLERNVMQMARTLYREGILTEIFYERLKMSALVFRRPLLFRTHGVNKILVVAMNYNSYTPKRRR